MSSCSDVSEYFDQPTCVAYCEEHAQLPAGTQGDTSGNTVGCRINQLGAATGDLASCQNAGQTGNGTCGTLCENYCHLAFTNCAAEPGQFETRNDCLSACQQKVAAGMTLGQPGDAGGDSLHCRIYHAGVAGDPLSGGSDVHCPHASDGGGGVCIDE